MNITRSIVIDAPIDKVWQTAAHDFDKIDAWASLVHRSEADESKAPVSDSSMAGRVCQTPFGKSYETFEMYDEKRHTFRYAGKAEKQPPFVKRGANTWTVEAVSSAQSRLIMSVDMELNLFPGQLMRLPMTAQLRKVLDWNLEEIKHYIETGKPHPRKLKAMSKATVKQAVQA